jgi:hypothetical protein
VPRKRTGTQRDYAVGYKKPPKHSQFKDGNPGGPGGPNGESLTTKLKRILQRPIKGGGTEADALIEMAVKAARRRDFRFFKEIIDRNDGKVPDRLAGVDGNELIIKVVRAEQKPDAGNSDNPPQTPSGTADSS